MPSFSLDSPLPSLARVGSTINRKLKSLGLENIQDLIFYLPWRYENFNQVVKISSLKDEQTVNIIGTIKLIQNRRSIKQRRYLTEALVSDDSGSIKILWFNQPFLTKSLKIGNQISLAGKISNYQGQTVMVSPQYEKTEKEALINTRGLVPVYSLVAGLTQKQLRYFIWQCLDLADKIPDWLPENIRQELKLLPLNKALKQIHFPKNQTEIEMARQRLGFSELFLRQLKAGLIKNQLKTKRAISLNFQEKTTKKFVTDLPFTLTTDQKKAAWEIIKDLGKQQPMFRLLEGDVGSGKTVVAAIAILNAVRNNQQVILMAPTEILAYQHKQSLTKLFKSEGAKIGLLTSSDKSANFPLPSKKKDVEAVILEKADLIIGTQALIYRNRLPKKLALAIIDEQHRFGVAQRQSLLNNNQEMEFPHLLSLTATPIPRSLALTIYGDLDLSIIKTQPPGRQPILTKVVVEDERSTTYDFIKEKLKIGQQAFVICPLVENSDKLSIKSAQAEHKRLSQEIFPNFSVGLLHGRLKSPTKEKVMADFLAGKIQVLVSTAVVEVGIDVPQATAMIIEGAERFGLAQLHQFRGRIGRGKDKSYCFLFTSQENSSQKAKFRLQSLSRYQDGLSLAKLDLSLRGSGDIYGYSQSGFDELKIASLFDYQLIKDTRQAVTNLLSKDPELKNHQALKEKLGNWEEKIHWE